MNTITISGNLTRDPELRHTANSKAMCKFSIAHNDRYGDKEAVHFFDVTAWGGWAESANNLAKGDHVVIHGKLVYESWEAKDGGKRSAVKIMAFEVYGQPRGRKSAPAQRGTVTDEGRQDEAVDDGDESCPF